MSAQALGVVLAGGLSTRFGSDKAQARMGKLTLLDHAIASLQCQCHNVVVAGRAGANGVPDWPHAGMGPLGGIAGGLRHAREQGFKLVLTCGVDSPGLPDDLFDALFPAPSYVVSQPVIGLWPVECLAAIETILTGEERHSMFAFARAIGARAVELARRPVNINRPHDLAEAESNHGL